MDIAIIGVGHVGLTTAAVLADHGHGVVALDDDPAKLATEWDQIATLDPADIKAALDYPILIDGRNCIDARTAIEAGLRYHGIGRGHLRS